MPQASETPTRDKLLDAAQELMLSRGYVATSVDGICSAAGVTKGSFFHYFDNKEDLGKVLLERFASRQAETMMSACAAKEDPLDRIYCLIDGAIQSSRDPEMKGCLIGTFAQEISETHPELKAVCQASFDGFSQGMGADFVAAKERYCPDAGFDAEGLGRMFLALAQGSMLILRANGDRAAMGRNLVHFREYLKTLYGR